VATETITCYRHPDRRAGVKCQRCERWICPDCMVQASVGFHCPECAQTGRQQVYTSRSLAAYKPIVTYTLIGLNLAVFIIGGFLDPDAFRGVSGDLFVEGNLIGAFSTDGFTVAGGVADGEVYRIVTSGFLHAGFAHVAMNMFFLYLIGPMLEKELGRINFGLLYFTAMLAGSFGVLLIDPFVPTVGASGAIYGLLGAAVALQISRGINPWTSGIGALILINIFITFAVPNISIGGHLGGLVGGFLAGYLLVGVDEKLPQKWMAPAICVVFAGLLVAGSVWAADYALQTGQAVI
jgi:membrane associated rhomboid family serine protease